MKLWFTVAGLILLFVVLMFSACAQNSSEVESLKAKVAMLESKQAELVSRLTAIEGAPTSGDVSIEDLETKLKNIEKEIWGINYRNPTQVSRVDDLESEVYGQGGSNLSSRIDELRRNIDDLENEVYGLAGGTWNSRVDEVESRIKDLSYNLCGFSSCTM